MIKTLIENRIKKFLAEESGYGIKPSDKNVIDAFLKNTTSDGHEGDTVFVDGNLLKTPYAILAKRDGNRLFILKDPKGPATTAIKNFIDKRLVKFNIKAYHKDLNVVAVVAEPKDGFETETVVESGKGAVKSAEKHKKLGKMIESLILEKNSKVIKNYQKVLKDRYKSLSKCTEIKSKGIVKCLFKDKDDALSFFNGFTLTKTQATENDCSFEETASGFVVTCKLSNLM